MLNLLTLQSNYTSSLGNLVEDFYKPCLENSVSYDRASGYFSSGAMRHLLMRPMATFASGGGHIRLVCSPVFSNDDIEAIKDGYDWRLALEPALDKEIDKVLNEPGGDAALDFVSCLIATGALDISIAFKLGSKGIFHVKHGIFRDESQNTVVFTGSNNESQAGWSDNLNYEAFEVFRSWKSQDENDRVTRHVEDFEGLWDNQVPKLSVSPFPKVAREKLVARVTDNNPIAVYEEYESTVSSKTSTASPRKTPHCHQIQAVEAWNANDHRGILEHATGSGKTFTAILAITEWLRHRGPVIVLVPTIVLQDQWYKELKATINEFQTSIIRAGGGYDTWRNSTVVNSITSNDQNNRSVLIATMPTASREAFINQVSPGEHLLIVGDEVHWLGAATFSKCLQIASGGRLGLSATPERYEDTDGTAILFDYFGPIVHKFTLKEAIEAGRLCRYNYYVRPVEMNSSEAARWITLSKRIGKAYARLMNGGDPQKDEGLKQLKIKRSRIAKSVQSKNTIPGDILEESYQEGDRWLVYCEDRKQLSKIADNLKARGLRFSEYHSYTESDRSSVLDKFASIGGILVAIHCLDEGIDIPEITHAIILASSSNPRQFIQRRGRVLRASPGTGKAVAVIYDVLVEPPKTSMGQDDFGSLVKTEIRRSLSFIEDCENQSERKKVEDWGATMGVYSASDEVVYTSNTEDTELPQDEHD